MSMIRPGTIVWFCIVIAVGYAMFQVKYEVMRQEQTLATINRQIAEDREQIRVLNAEWSYLIRPNRIAQLAGRFLHLSDMSSAQIVPLGDVPFRANAAGAPTADPATASARSATVKPGTRLADTGKPQP